MEVRGSLCSLSALVLTIGVLRGKPHGLGRDNPVAGAAALALFDRA
jgi:hypothetical protein